MAGCWISYCKVLKACEDRCANGLAKVAVICARRPYTAISVSLTLCLLLMLGLLGLEIVTDGDDLWVNQDASSLKNLRILEDTFEQPPRPNSIIVTAKAEGSNVLTQAALAETFRILTGVERVTADGNNYSSICVRSVLGTCKRDGLVRFWNSSQSVFDTSVTSDADVLAAVSAPRFPDLHNPVQRSMTFGGFTTSASGSIISSNAFLVTWDVEESDAGRAWEDAFIKHFVVEKTSMPAQEYEHVKVYLNGRSSLDKELARNVSGEVHLFGLAFLVMVVFCCSLFGKPLKIVEGRGALGCFEVVMVIFSIGAGYGLATLCGVKFTMLQEVLPFILLGIGMDDAFVIINAFDRTDPDLEVSERIRETMHRVGVSIMFTSLTDFLAFMFGMLSKMPAVRFFCGYAACSIILIFVMHISCFCAVLALDARRQANGRVDCCCCIALATPKVVDVEISVRKISTASQETVLTKPAQFFGVYARCLTGHIGVKLVVLAFCITLAGVSLGAIVSGLDTGLDMVDLVPDESYLRQYIGAEEKHWGTDTIGRALAVVLVFRGIDQSSATVQSSMYTSTHGLMNQSSIDRSMGIWTWHDAFTSWAVEHRNAGLTLNGLLPAAAFEMGSCPGYHSCGPFLTGSTHGPAVRRFLQEPSFAVFKDDIVFEGNSVKASRVFARHNDMKFTHMRVEALTQMEEYNEGLQDQMPGAFISAQYYPIFDQYRMIQDETIMTFSLCLVAVLLVSSFVLVYPLSMGVLTLSLLMVFCDLIGSLYMWGLKLNGITMICLIMSIGLVVDYNSHMVHSFAMQDSLLPRNDRVVLSLQEMGPSVLLGACSTFFGIMPLSLATSHVFRTFFKMFVGIVSVGILHGLVFVPVALSIIGPSATTTEPISEQKRPWEAWGVNGKQQSPAQEQMQDETIQKSTVGQTSLS